MKSNEQCTPSISEIRLALRAQKMERREQNVATIYSIPKMKVNIDFMT